MIAAVTTVHRLSDYEANAICERLTRPGSEFQEEVKARASTTPVAVLLDGDAGVVAWAATHQWRGMQTLEGFTSKKYRRKGLARAAAAMLVASGSLTTDRTVAVFSMRCVDIARSVGICDVKVFDLIDDEWVEVTR